MSPTAEQSQASAVRPLRQIADPFVAAPAVGVCLRTRLKGLTDPDEAVLRAVGTHLGRLAAADLAARVRAGVGHDNDAWAIRKRDLTAASTSRWAGAITKATHDQWALARRAARRRPAAQASRIHFWTVVGDTPTSSAITRTDPPLPFASAAAARNSASASPTASRARISRSRSVDVSSPRCTTKPPSEEVLNQATTVTESVTVPSIC